MRIYELPDFSGLHKNTNSAFPLVNPTRIFFKTNKMGVKDLLFQ